MTTANARPAAVRAFELEDTAHAVEQAGSEGDGEGDAEEGEEVFGEDGVFFEAQAATVHDPIGTGEEDGHDGGLVGVPVAVWGDDEVTGGAELGVFDGEGSVFDDGFDGGEAGLLVVGDEVGIGVTEGTHQGEADEQDEDGRGESPRPD